MRAKTLKDIRNDKPLIWFKPSHWGLIFMFITLESIFIRNDMWELSVFPVLIGAYFLFYRHRGPKDKRKLKYGPGEKPMVYWSKRLFRKMRAKKYVRGKVDSYFDNSSVQ